MVRPLDESQGSSPLQGHGSWLVCEVALKIAQPQSDAITYIPLTDIKGKKKLKNSQHNKALALS